MKRVGFQVGLGILLVAGLSCARGVAVPESAVAQTVAAAVLSKVRNHAAAPDSSPDSLRAMTIGVPSGAAWDEMRQQLMRTLHGRGVRDDDRFVLAISIRDATVDRDRLVSHFTIADVCNATDTLDEIDYVAEAVRHGQSFAQPKTTEVLFVDGVCRVATPTRRDTTIILGRVERDLTGDGKPEILSLIGKGKTIDSLDVTLSIESVGPVIYHHDLAPLTRRTGYDERAGTRPAAQQRAYLDEFAKSFLGPGKFATPAEFLDAWKAQGDHVAEIPAVMARDGGGDPAAMADKWLAMQRSGITIFEFSPGGDGILAIAWNAADKRFYNLIECC